MHSEVTVSYSVETVASKTSSLLRPRIAVLLDILHASETGLLTKLSTFRKEKSAMLSIRQLLTAGGACGGAYSQQAASRSPIVLLWQHCDYLTHKMWQWQTTC